MFTAILAALLSEDWTTPKIEELRISPDRCLLAPAEGRVSFKTFVGAEADLIHNIHRIAAVAELGYLLGKVAEISALN